MKPDTILCDIIHALFHRPPASAPRQPPPEAPARGIVHWAPDACTGCALCTRDCPARALELTTLDRKARRFIMRYHADRCAYCAQCVQTCRFGCLQMRDASDNGSARPAATKGRFTRVYGEEADLAELNERREEAEERVP
ncbi:MAG: 4Fe-4S dicluster domain-containing protein [Candidatus Promineifilaceae bacterium]|nr:4Fe-4S dicluster domain-containing protein [Candidatus Promineifilaceae bacterium]